MSLVLTRRAGEAIMIGSDIEIRVLEIHGNQVRIGVTAPPEVSVDREEVRLRKQLGSNGHDRPFNGYP